MSSTVESIPYQQLKPTFASQKLKNLPIEHIQRALLVAAVACAILSLIPNVGWVGALTLRSFSCGVVSLHLLHGLKNKQGKGVLLLQIMRLTSVALGLAGVATHLNLLVITSLALGIMVQCGEAGRGSLQKDPYKALTHMSFVLLDAFALAAMVTGGWQYMVTAAVLNSVVMFAFATKAIVVGVMKRDVNAAFDAACYISLGAIGIASAVRTAEIIGQKPTQYHYTFRSSRYNCTLYDKHGNIVAKAKIFEPVSFSLDPRDTYDRGGVLVDYQYGNYVTGPSHIEGVPIMIQRAMTSSEFPTLPVGSAALATENPTIRAETPPVEQIDSAALDAFLNPELGPPQSCVVINEKATKLVLRHAHSDAQYTFDQKAVSAISTLQTSCSIQNVDRETFIRLATFLHRGEINPIDQLSENALIHLLQCAESLQISRLRLLCQREIARRLKHLEWNDTSLFRQVGSLDPLLALFNFHRGL
ncbi:MAG: hypothetical protein S4CHLAM2_02570 [Chlamydiales bacterium]|nr:hypothetical protein [Chlamydiales bacterium]